jgi:hypothetical protein
LEKKGFVSGKGKEKMRKKFWGSKKEVLMITKSCILVQKAGLLTSGRYPQFPKNLAGQKVSLKVSSTKRGEHEQLRAADFR